MHTYATAKYSILAKEIAHYVVYQSVSQIYFTYIHQHKVYGLSLLENETGLYVLTSGNPMAKDDSVISVTSAECYVYILFKTTLGMQSVTSYNVHGCTTSCFKTLVFARQITRFNQISCKT